MPLGGNVLRNMTTIQERLSPAQIFLQLQTHVSNCPCWLTDTQTQHAQSWIPTAVSTPKPGLLPPSSSHCWTPPCTPHLNQRPKIQCRSSLFLSSHSPPTPVSATRIHPLCLPCHSPVRQYPLLQSVIHIVVMGFFSSSDLITSPSPSVVPTFLRL